MLKVNENGMIAIRTWLACVTDGSESPATWALAAERAAGKLGEDWDSVVVELPPGRSLIGRAPRLILKKEDFSVSTG